MGWWFRFKSSVMHGVGRIIFIVIAILAILFIWVVIKNGGNIMKAIDNLMTF